MTFYEAFCDEIEKIAQEEEDRGGGLSAGSHIGAGAAIGGGIGAVRGARAVPKAVEAAKAQMEKKHGPMKKWTPAQKSGWKWGKRIGVPAGVGVRGLAGAGIGAGIGAGVYGISRLLGDRSRT